MQVNHSGTPETSHYGGTARSSEQAAGNARVRQTSAEAQEPESEEARAAQPVRASARQKAAEVVAGARLPSLTVECSKVYVHVHLQEPAASRLLRPLCKCGRRLCSLHAHLCMHGEVCSWAQRVQPEVRSRHQRDPEILTLARRLRRQKIEQKIAKQREGRGTIHCCKEAPHNIDASGNKPAVMFQFRPSITPSSHSERVAGFASAFHDDT